MAAASYTTDLTLLTAADATTGFSEPTSSTAGGTPSVETDFFIQGSACVSKTFNATGIGGLAYDNSSAVTIPADGAVFTWTYYSCPNALSTKVNGGVQILVGSSTANYKRFYTAGSNTYTYGGWVNYPVNPTVTASATVGTPTSATQVFGFAVNSANSVTKGNPFGIDVIRYGRGTLQFTGGDLANGYATLDGAATQNDTVANRWGILSFVDGGFKYQGHLLLGTAGTAVDFRDSNKAVNIQNTEFVTSNFNLIEVRNAASNVSMTSMTFSALGTVSRGNFLCTDNATVLLDSCTFTDMGTFSFLSNTTVDSSVFRRCGTITHGNANLSNCLITASYATTAVTTATPATIQDCRFVSAGTGHAVTITTPGTYTFSGNLFSNYGATGTTNAAIYNNSGGSVTLNISGGGDVPTYRNGTSASTTIVAAANVTLTGLLAGTEVRAYTGTDPASFILIDGVESSGTSFTFSQSVAGQSGYIHIFHVDRQPIYQPITYSGSDTSIPIQQTIDRQYVNPA